MKMRGNLKIVLGLFVLWAVVPAFGQKGANPHANDINVNVSNLEEGIPLCVEDGTVLPPDHVEAQGIINWGSADRNDWWEYRTQVSMGMHHQWQGTLGVVFRDNEVDATGDGDISLKVMHQFRDNKKDAASFGIDLNFPSGQNYARLDTTYPPFTFVVNERKNNIDVGLMGVYTRVLSNAKKRERLHLEVKETFVRSAPEGFADTQLFLGLGFDKLVRDDTLAMVGLCWVEGSSPCNHDSSVLQLGLRRQESPRFLWGAGLKIGLDWAAADWGLVWGAQYGL